MIANDIIGRALRDLTVIPSGGTPTANQYADGLALLNDMINEWSVNGNLTYEDTLEELTIPASTQSITIGATGTLVTARPVRLIAHTLKESGGTEYPLRQATDAQYNRFTDKTIVGRPEWIHLRKTYPDATIYFEYVTDQEYTLVLTSMKALSTFTDGATDVSLPDQYSYALRSNLVVEGAGMFGAQKRVTSLMVRTADRAKQSIIGDALQFNESTTDIGSGSRYNIEAG